MQFFEVEVVKIFIKKPMLSSRVKMGLPASGYSIFCTLKWEFMRSTIKNGENESHF